MTKAELKEKRSNLVTELDARLDKFAEAPDTYSAEEVTKSTAMQKEIDNLSTAIEVEENRELLQKHKLDREFARQRAGGTPEGKLQKEFSFLRLLKSQLPNQRLDGAELDVHQMAVQEFKDLNIDMGNSIGIPSSFMATQKDIVVGTGTAGGDAVQTDIQPVIPFLRVALKAEELGATVLRGLKGPQKFPRRDNSPSSAWEGETDTTAEVTSTIDFFTMDAKRNAAWMEMSAQAIIQMNPDVEGMARDDLSFAVKKAVDIAAFNGPGTGNAPTGLLNTSGIGDVAMGAPDGGAWTWAKALEFMSTLNTNNADDKNIKWAMTPGAKASAMGIEKAANTANFIINEPGNSLLGAPVTWTNNMPSNLTKGAGTSLHTAVLGNWPDLLIGNWAGISILVDPYTRAKDGVVQMIVNSFWDVGVRQPSAFVASLDLDVS